MAIGQAQTVVRSCAKWSQAGTAKFTVKLRAKVTVAKKPSPPSAGMGSLRTIKPAMMDSLSSTVTAAAFIAKSNQDGDVKRNIVGKFDQPNIIIKFLLN